MIESRRRDIWNFVNKFRCSRERQRPVGFGQVLGRRTGARRKTPAGELERRLQLGHAYKI
jgi:hypothetical protein